jgi:hypothetical protein
MNIFANTYVDLDDEEKGKIVVEVEMQMTCEFNEYMDGHKFLQLKNNFIHKGLVPMEYIFYINYVPIKPTAIPKYDNVEE